jgi:hypothetical protein
VPQVQRCFRSQRLPPALLDLSYASGSETLSNFQVSSLLNVFFS